MTLTEIVKELVGPGALTPMLQPYEADGFYVWCVQTGEGREFATLCWAVEDYR